MEKRKKKVCFSSVLPSSPSNWERLPHDLLYSILDKLDTLSDYIRLSAVCKLWNSMALNHKEKRIQLSNNHQLPLLFARTMEDAYKPELRLYNFRPGSAKVCNFKLLVPGKNKRSKFCGSSHGWLVFFVPKKSELLVSNPFSGSIIRLPPLISTTKVRRDIIKVALSRNPSSGSFEVLAAFGGLVAYLNFGDQFWSFSQALQYHPLSALTFYKGSFIGVSPKGSTLEAEIASIVSLNVIQSYNNKTSSYIEFKEIAADIEFIGRPKDYYFVETTNGDLLLVCKLHGGTTYKIPPTYKVFKIMDSNEKLELTPVVNLDGHSLFLHNGGCISVIASNYPGCWPNAVYNLLQVQGSSYCARIQQFKLECGSSEIQQDGWLPSGAFEGCWILPSMRL
ncbi:hypothetical protein FNV43_RR02160 [Rhamnella rubrinervis]|uniref:F-box domain-containing protein n=1 Tax=Rhamnella rubrinervis TaxID=2594499 RepID=A0A8K0HQZ0_9ROSA|nr:hypothetical protein FNV43_RR02160 [Rhamnella rubrinervis]